MKTVWARLCSAGHDSRVGWWLALLSVLLLLPGVSGQPFADDHLHRAMLEAQPDALVPLARAPWDLFSFLDGNPAHNRAWMDAGLLPIWASPELQVAFLRPVASALHAAEYRLGTPHWWMQLHSLAWLGICVVLFHRLCRRWLPPAGCLVATLVYAVDDAHVTTAVWVANRGALIATACVLAAVLVDLRARETGRRVGWATPLLMVLGLGASDMAAVAIGLWIFHALRHDRRVIPSVVLAIGLTAAWRIGAVLLGRGLNDSGAYFDPLTDPLAFIKGLGFHGPALLLGVWTPIPSGLTLDPATRHWTMPVAWGVTAVFVVVLWVVRRQPGVGAWAIAFAFSLTSVAAGFPANRNLIVVAMFVALACGATVGLWSQRRWLRAGVGVVLLVHLGLAPLARLIIAQTHGRLPQTVARFDAQWPERGEAWLVGSPTHLLHVFFPAFARLNRTGTLPKIRNLGCGAGGLTIARVDATTFEVSGVAMADHVGDRLVRPTPEFPSRAEIDGAVMEVIADEPEGRRVLRWSFERVPEDVAFLVWNPAEKRFERHPMLIVGASIVLPPAPISFP